MPCPRQLILPSAFFPFPLSSILFLHHHHLKNIQQEFSCLSLFFTLISRQSIFLTANCSNCLMICLPQLWFTAVKCSLASGLTSHSVPLIETKVKLFCLEERMARSQSTISHCKLNWVWFLSLCRCPQGLMGHISVCHLCRLMAAYRGESAKCRRQLQHSFFILAESDLPVQSFGVLQFVASQGLKSWRNSRGETTWKQAELTSVLPLSF